MDKINTTRFPKIETNYEHAIGAIERAGNPQQARIRFEQALRVHRELPGGDTERLRTVLTWAKELGW